MPPWPGAKTPAHVTRVEARQLGYTSVPTTETVVQIAVFSVDEPMIRATRVSFLLTDQQGERIPLFSMADAWVQSGIFPAGRVHLRVADNWSDTLFVTLDLPPRCKSIIQVYLRSNGPYIDERRRRRRLRFGPPVAARVVLTTCPDAAG